MKRNRCRRHKKRHKKKDGTLYDCECIKCSISRAEAAVPGALCRPVVFDLRDEETSNTSATWAWNIDNSFEPFPLSPNDVCIIVHTGTDSCTIMLAKDQKLYTVNRMALHRL